MAYRVPVHDEGRHGKRPDEPHVESPLDVDFEGGGCVDFLQRRLPGVSQMSRQQIGGDAATALWIQVVV